jgi:hypothetical protein
MKSSLAACACGFLVLSFVASFASADVSVKPGAVVANETISSLTISPTEAFDIVKTMKLPPGVTLTGTTEPIKKTTESAIQSTESNAETLQEFFGGCFPGCNWGGWCGCGPHRFGFKCGGIIGWAYPIHFWNLCGPRFFGGCGLGIACGDLFFC